MIETEHRRLHWQGTKINALVSIAILAGFLLLVSLLTGLFGGWVVLGFPFVFYLAAQGVFFLMIILVYWSAGRQEATDRRHGASEEI